MLNLCLAIKNIKAFVGKCKENLCKRSRKAELVKKRWFNAINIEAYVRSKALSPRYIVWVLCKVLYGIFLLYLHYVDRWDHAGYGKCVQNTLVRAFKELRHNKVYRGLYNKE